MLNNCRLLQLFGASTDFAWRQSLDMLGVEKERLPPAGGDGMVVVLDGKPLLAERIDYRLDPDMAPLADPNPFHAPPTYPLRRRLADLASDDPPELPSAMAEISAALGRL